MIMPIKDLVKLRNRYHKEGDLGQCARIDYTLEQKGYTFEGKPLPWRIKLDRDYPNNY